MGGNRDPHEILALASLSKQHIYLFLGMILKTKPIFEGSHSRNSSFMTIHVISTHYNKKPNRGMQK